MTDPLLQVCAALAAAISLLERGGKKAAPSDKMFEQMLIDYKAALEVGRRELQIKADAQDAVAKIQRKEPGDDDSDACEQ